MLSGLSEVVAGCYRRAGECRERAERSVSSENRPSTLNAREAGYSWHWAISS